MNGKKLLSYIYLPLLVVGIFLLVGSGARATTFCVGCGAPGAGCGAIAPSIGAAVAAANGNAVAFDTIRVAPGTYIESFPGIPIIGIFPASDTIRIQGGWDIAACSVRADVMNLANRNTAVNAGLASNIFNAIGFFDAIHLEVSGFTLLLGTGLGGAIGGAISTISLVSTVILDVFDNILVANNTIVGGAISVITLVVAATAVDLERNVCFDNSGIVFGGCYSTISAIVGFTNTVERNNIMAQNQALLGGGESQIGVAIAANTAQRRNNTVADNTGNIAGGGWSVLNGGAAAVNATTVNDMIISNLTGIPTLGLNILAFGGGLPTVISNRKSNVGQNPVGGVLGIAGGVVVGLTAALPCDGAGANSVGPEDSSVAQFVDPFAGFPNYRLNPASPCNTQGDKDTFAGEAAFAPTDFEGNLRDNSIGAAAPTPSPTPSPSPSPSVTPVTPTPVTPTPVTPTPGGGGGGGCALAGGMVQLGTSMANILIPLVPVFAIGLRVLRRRTKKGEK